MRIAAFLAFIALSALPAAADPPCEMVSFCGANPTGADAFGTSVNMRGVVAIVGADSNGGAAGFARIYRKGANGWAHESRIDAADGTPSDLFGESVAIHGDYAVVGAPYAQDGGHIYGAAYVFKRVNGVWTQQARLAPPSPQDYCQFGKSVAITGTRVVIGAPSEYLNGSPNGAAYTFKLSGNAWVYDATIKPQVPGGSLGTSISYDGTRAVIGAPTATSNGVLGAGRVFIYTRSDAGWAKESVLAEGAPTSDDNFGTSVSVTGLRILIGAPNAPVNGVSAGKAFFFARVNNKWTFEDAVTSPAPVGFDKFGTSVSLDGDLAVVSSFSQYKALAAVLARNGSDWKWTELLYSNLGYYPSSFGKSVSTSGGQVVIGEPGFYRRPPTEQGGAVNFTGMTPTSRASLNKDGGQANGASTAGEGSGNAQIVVFQSTAANMFAGDTNGMTDIFARDRITGVNRRVSSALGTQPSNGNSSSPSIAAPSTNVSSVVFASDATNLDQTIIDSNGKRDVFYAVIYLPFQDTYTVLQVSRGLNGQPANGASDLPKISAHGNYIVFQSTASNLVANDTNNASDIFLYDVGAQTISRVSVTSAGGQATGGGSFNPAISEDGTVITFASDATNLDPIHADTNAKTDIFVRDLNNSQTRRVSKTAAGVQGNFPSTNPRISSTGRYVVFTSQSSTLSAGDTNQTLDAFRHDRQTGALIRVSIGAAPLGNAASNAVGVSWDGNLVLFNSKASNLVANDTNNCFDAFLRNVSAGTTRRVGLGVGWQEPTTDTNATFMTADGNAMIFQSASSNLVAGDSGQMDVFYRDLCDTP